MSLLHSFRKAASNQGLSFSDQNQEDAHEFLTSVLDQMRSLSSLLQVNAANMNRRYICPVKRHLVFEIEKTRTCNKCGDQSKRKEEFTDLSLDLIPYGSVKEMLQEYVKESELEYKCECGGNTSGQSMAFETLPNVLILHIKRFIYSPSYELMKLHDPVKLHRDLVVSSNQGDGCYSLISTFPNINQSCYMNSILQSLFAMVDLITDIMCQKPVWSSVPEAKLIRSAAATPAPVSAKSSKGGKPNKRLWKNILYGHCLKEHTNPKEERFPNINQSCYMNSILQSLFAMVNLITDIMCQKPVWSSVPKAKLIRSLMAIKDAHPSSDTWNKMSLLHSFRKAASTQGLSFSDQNQEDAHEFLTSVLDQMRSLSSLLQVNAANMNRRYICPVKRHLVFEIEKTRTCNKCGDQSKRKEEFTDLSLDLIPYGSVKEMLQEYVKESELEYKCECGGNTSGQSMAFETLPSNVLILHIKRFIYSPTYELMKLHDPVKLHRDLVVSSNQGDGCYSLISIVSHFGSNGKAGHYICDGVHPDDSLSQTTDHWLTFNDSLVRNTTGASVCEKRRESSYILFYKRHNRKRKKEPGSSMPQLMDPRTNPFDVIRTKTGPPPPPGLLTPGTFPNINQSCYMNSILQSLFAMVDLITDIMCQKPVWSSVPEAKLIRSFIAIRDAHPSSDTRNKRSLLHSFRKAASNQGLSFSDQNQEDAHEFLTSVLDQMRSLSSLLQVNAANMNRRYICPVKRHLVFEIEKTRTCNNVLILHIKRFIYSPTYELMKLHDPVELPRDLVVSSNQGDGCYSLISIVSHFGSNGEAGHYICDGVHPDDSLSQTTDHWLTFNDSLVRNTTGASVCEKRRESSYILFYKRHKPVWSSVPEAKLIRSLVAIKDAHPSSDTWNKRSLLHSFRKAASTQGLSFSDQNQEDAHEFLTSVLDQMRSLSSLLQVNAANMNRRYICPVKRHLVFEIEKTRTCNKCGDQSKRKEEFTNLSLDLIPYGSVKEMLQEYVKESELEYKCECGGNTSGQSMAFETLPNVLILHIKRFIYSPTYELMKLHDPVELHRDLVVSSNQGQIRIVSMFERFPNINQSCYMNSILQSLFAMVDLIMDIMCQKPVWSSVPEAKLIRSFIAIRDAHPSSDTRNKMSLLHSFRKAASNQGLSFSDQNQEDAHEFLTSVLDQMRSLSSLLQVNAANMNRRYICPVKRHLVFEIEKTRTCNK
ncbi:Ubiquitin carboxyl-terminal hydrolase 37 [Larimichthys crocea]|uniref:Ubiquitin carboxyl-terminal hydrolase 37 n=1 Tax=Larimichthys crocea TaxID=215358 RepID=A0A6G0I736_LARCR|nr:Ubiquitin carboxyl-terminal hydrolase 37 [Larimichthys crocea]